MAIVDLEEQCDHLLEEIENNCRRAAKIRMQIERLEVEKREVPKESFIPHPSFHEEVVDEERDDFEDEVDYYLSDYRMLDSSFEKEDLLSILPKKSNYHYQDIIFRLQAESIREIKEIDEILLESDEITKEELSEYRELLDVERKKISILKECLNDHDLSQLEEEEKNQIILVPTSYGNIRIIDELEHLPRDYYSNFYELIQSIIDGSFKGVKRFTNNRLLVGMSEVKAFKIRVVFTRISKNSYALITAFMKKSDNEKIYQESLQNKVSEYRKIEKDLKQNLSNESFLQDNEKNVKELFELLAGVKEDEKGCSL